MANDKDVKVEGGGVNFRKQNARTTQPFEVQNIFKTKFLNKSASGYVLVHFTEKSQNKNVLHITHTRYPVK